MKFEDAFCTTLNRPITIEEVSYIFQNDRDTFISAIKDSLICPECKNVPLIYNNAATPYFSVYPKAIHSESCTLRQDEMDADEASRFLSDITNKQIIQRQMDSLISQILSEASPKLANPKAAFMQSTFSKSSKSKTPVSSKRLSRKRIDLPFREEDFNCEKIFYGRVHLKWEKCSNSSQDAYKILLCHTVKKTLLCKLKITSKVYSYLPSKYKSINELECAVAFVALFSEDSTKHYQATHLKHSERITIEPI